jgi:hypothetical protein
MTETAFMTEDIWDDDVAEDLAKSMRAAPIVKDHPDWWILASADGCAV